MSLHRRWYVVLVQLVHLGRFLSNTISVIMVLNMFISPDVSDKQIVQDIISNSDFVFLKICLLVISKGGKNYLA